MGGNAYQHKQEEDNTAFRINYIGQGALAAIPTYIVVNVIGRDVMHVGIASGLCLQAAVEASDIALRPSNRIALDAYFLTLPHGQ
jgi:hypothetical protein